MPLALFSNAGAREVHCVPFVDDNIVLSPFPTAIQVSIPL